MPRASNSKAGSIVNFFRTAPMEVAELILGLCKDAIGERKAKVDKIREGQKAGKKKGAKPAKVVAIPQAVVAKPAKVRKRKSRAKTNPRHLQPEALPGDEAGEVEGDLDLGLEPSDDHIAGSGTIEP